MVLERLMEAINSDTGEEATFLKSKLGEMDRNLVKKAVMATPYGISRHTIATGLFKLDLVKSAEPKELRNKIPNYLSNKLFECIKATVDPNNLLTEWLMDAASRLADLGLCIEWEAPNGFLVVQSEWKTEVTEIGTEAPTMMVYEPKTPLEIDPGKQRSKIVPNFIHSLDAAHLVLTINRLSSCENLRHFGVVHDSYAVHGCDVDTLNRVLREEFVERYQNLDLSNFPINKEIEGQNVIEPPPARGSFDIQQVLNSDYFFS